MNNDERTDSNSILRPSPSFSVSSSWGCSLVLTVQHCLFLLSFPPPLSFVLSSMSTPPSPVASNASFRRRERPPALEIHTGSTPLSSNVTNRDERDDGFLADSSRTVQVRLFLSLFSHLSLASTLTSILAQRACVPSPGAATDGFGLPRVSFYFNDFLSGPLLFWSPIWLGLALSSSFTNCTIFESHPRE